MRAIGGFCKGTNVYNFKFLKDYSVKRVENKEEGDDRGSREGDQLRDLIQVKRTINLNSSSGHVDIEEGTDSDLFRKGISELIVVRE